MPELPSVSIVTPSFNHAPYLGATMRSVLDQDYPNLEYVVMDGASTDGTLELLRAFDATGLPASAGRATTHPLKRANRAGHDHAQFTWTSAPDAGQADAINRGFARTTGEIIAWLNSDDCYKPGAILAAATYLRDHPEVALVYGDAEFIRPDGSILCPCANTEPFNRRRLLHYSDYIVQPAAFFRRSAFQSVGGLDASLHYAMDYDLWLKLAAKFDFAYVPQVWAQYRWLGENKSATGSWKRIEEVREVTRRHGAKRLPAYFRLEAANLHWQAARKAISAGRLGQAMRSAFKATGQAVCSPRAIGALLDSRTRRVIRTGRVLRDQASSPASS
jgi:glycosyltransferase involved in cell wall biosynthesis